MALMCHGTFDYNNIYFVLIIYLIEYRKKLAKITAKCKKQTGPSSKIDVSGFKLECAKMFLMLNWVFQNVSHEVLLAWSKFQAKIPTRSRVCVQGK